MRIEENYVTAHFSCIVKPRESRGIDNYLQDQGLKLPSLLGSGNKILVEIYTSFCPWIHFISILPKWPPLLTLVDILVDFQKKSKSPPLPNLFTGQFFCEILIFPEQICCLRQQALIIRLVTLYVRRELHERFQDQCFIQRKLCH